MSLEATSRARKAIESYVEGSDLVPIITWSVETDSGDGSWILGFIEAARASTAPSEMFKEVSGIRLLIDGPNQWIPLLDDVTLDYLDGRFVFRPV